MSEMTKAEAPSAHTMAAMTAAAVFVRLADKMNSLYIVTGHALRPCTVCFKFIPEDDRKRRRQICVRLPNLEALR